MTVPDDEKSNSDSDAPEWVLRFERETELRKEEVMERRRFADELGIPADAIVLPAQRWPGQQSHPRFQGPFVDYLGVRLTSTNQLESAPYLRIGPYILQVWL